MKYVLYKSADGTQDCFAPESSFEKCPELSINVDGEQMVKDWEVEANSWVEAMTKFHEYMGWEPYVPCGLELANEEPNR